LDNISKHYLTLQTEPRNNNTTNNMRREFNKTEETGNKPEIFVLKPYNHKQLADFYGVCWLTFQRWVKKHEAEIGKKTGHFYSINQVIIIFKIFGMPKRFKVSMTEVEEMFKAA
ncbi:MAG TPA: hypothetical protein PKD30_14165, partial [Saprospiraceae bacterium]|nr:hypothetical protein [Saprospiraceae bacterium]